ncbi:HAMP domain-containing histidine kinase [Aminipila butyrica]|uniref:histidine kinase n=1 Tax=Aminipila butyrica TaxID=433296 RepID=A0A858BTD5_9FIRM|nr:HAMP domain-containing sensor histidine kinase [Aminipila butyrica]QIB68200.1 HAMP domain-containing histidine kinase [Aminipila butyrica]
MDTRWKNFNENMAVRTLAFALCVLLFAAALMGSIATVLRIDKAGRSFTLEEIFSTTNYLDSSDMQEEFNQDAQLLRQLIGEYKSEANIQSGNLLMDRDSELDTAIATLYSDGVYYYGDKKLTANPVNVSYDVFAEDGRFKPVMIIEGTPYLIKDYVNEEEYPDYDNMGREEARSFAREYVNYYLDTGNDQLREAFIAANQSQVEEIKTILIKDQLRSFSNLKDRLNEQKGMLYFVSDGVNSYTNMKKTALTGKDGATPDVKAFEKNPAYMIYADGKLKKVPSATAKASYLGDWDSNLENRFFTLYNDNLEVYLAFDESFIKEKQIAYRDTSDILGLAPMVAGCAIGTLILFLYLAVTTGRRDDQGQRKLYGLDGIWTELQVGGIFAAMGLGLWVAMIALGVWGYWTASARQISSLELGLFFMAWSILAAIGLWFTLSCIRLLKARQFWKNTLIYKLWNAIVWKLCRKVWQGAVSIYEGSSLMKKVVLIALAVCLLSATVFLAPVVLLAILALAPKWVQKFEGIKQGVEEVKNGNLSYKIPVEGQGELDRLAGSINQISAASSTAVQNELKNQRMKADLISNVSHDLKTPLTSMVTYIDLLKSEGLDSSDAPEYLRILDEKTERLRHLTEDLFEAAKASSGAMPVQLEKVELLSLINQGLGELDQRIRASGLEFIIHAEQEKYYVLADGQLLWRVVENLLGNVLKYALENSRVYIDVKEVGANSQKAASLITLEIKNISREPLNISADELMERFKRGDESRTTEGSGLGLAIAKDLVKLQNGWFEVFIDGDLFKAQVLLSKYQETGAKTE